MFFSSKYCQNVLSVLGVTYAFISLSLAFVVTGIPAKSAHQKKSEYLLNITKQLKELKNYTENIEKENDINENITKLNFEHIRNFDMDTDMNLETASEKVTEEELYANVGDKNNVSERSFVLLPGHKLKIPFLNAPLRTYKKEENNFHRTFISNIQGSYFGNIFNGFETAHDVTTEREDTPIKEENNIRVNPHYSNKPIYNDNIAAYIDKVNFANGAIGHQYQNQKHQNGFLDFNFQYPRNYPKDRKVSPK